MPLACVLFDLDGTLVDTAPDLIACLNEALYQHGFATVCPTQVRSYITFGASVMISASVKNESKAVQDAILTTMLAQYEQHIARYSRFFEGMLDVLDFIEACDLSWGIVTNKRERFAYPLVHALTLQHRAACVVCGDTTPYSKPHPEPLLEACRRINVLTTECVYIGDAVHDIEAGRKANMLTLAATYGYLALNDNPENWGADGLIHSPLQLVEWLEKVL